MSVFCAQPAGVTPRSPELPSKAGAISVTVIGLALLVVVGPMSGILGWLLGIVAVNALADDLQRIDPTGSITLEAGRSGGLYLSGFGSHIDPGCTVTAPDGQEVPVHLAEKVERIDWDGRSYVYVGHVEATVSGEYSFACDGSDLGRDELYALPTTVEATGVVPGVIGMVTGFVLGLSGIIVFVVGIVRLARVSRVRRELLGVRDDGPPGPVPYG